MPITDPEPPTRTHKATLHERIENDRLKQPGPTHSRGGGSSRIAALIATAKARLPGKD